MNVFDLVAKLTLDTSEYEKNLGNAGKGLGKIGSMAGTVGKALATGVATATAAVGAFAGASVKAGQGFDTSMSQLAATMNTTVDQIQNLRDFAQEMGATTAFSASQAADGLNILAMAGYTAQQQMDALPSVLSLAAAGGLELAQAADFATGVMAGFGQEISDVNTKHVADLLSTMSASAKGSVADFGTALSTVAGMASTTGQKMDDVAVALEILGNNNVSAAEGGNALNRVLKNLYQATDTGAKGLEALGVSAYTAEGEAKPLQDVLKELNGALDGMSTQAKNDALSEIFDAATLKTVPFLIDGVSESWDKLAKQIDEADGAASRMEATQLDNLTGDVTLFKSALEGAQIAVSDMLTPALRDFVKLGSSGLSNVTEALRSGDMESAFSAIGDAIGQALTNLTSLLPKAVEMGVSLLEALGNSIVTNLPIIMDSAMQIVEFLISTLLSNIAPLIEFGLQVIVTLAEGIASNLPTLIPQVIEVILTIIDTLLSNADMLVEAAIALITGLTDGILNALPILIERLPEIIVRMVSVLIDNTPKLLQVSMQAMLKLGIGLITYLPLLLSKIPLLIDQMKSKFLEGVSKFSEIGKNLVLGLWNGLKDNWGTIVNNLEQLGDQLVTAFKNKFGIHSPSTVFKALGEFCAEGFQIGISDLADGTIINDVQNKLGSSLRGVSASLTTGTTTLGGYGNLENNITITLEGDAKQLFKVMQTQSRMYSRTTGRSAFA